jgi:pimeloyl-ACP methyl ester carboxylesterase
MKSLLGVLLVLVLSVAPAAAQQYRTPEELADSNGQFVDVEGTRIYFVTQGSPEDPAVIFIHGFGGSTITWRDNLPAVAQAGYYAIALDLPPFGLSDKNPDLDYSRSGMADLVASLMETLGIERAAIVGHSMGGAVAAQFAVRHTQKVERIAFVAGGIFEALQRDDDDDNDDGRGPLSLLNAIDPKSPAAPILLRGLITREFFVDTLRSAYHDDSVLTDEAVDGYARLLLIEDAPIGFLAYVQAQETSPITLQELAAAVENMPVALIWGKEDTWVSADLGKTMAQAIAGSSLILYDEVGHLPMEEAVEAFNTDLIAFLNQ